MIKVGSRVKYIRVDNAEDLATGYYPPVGTCGTVVTDYFDAIEVAWDSGTKGDGVWLCEKSDVEEVLQSKIDKMTLDEAIAYSEAKANELMKAGMKYVAFCWGGYHDALVEVKNGNIIIDKEVSE